jgi:hypothetical protein
MATEKRLIDANAALEQVCGNCCCDFEECKRIGFCADYMNIERLPTVDAVEVVHGEWLYDSGSGKCFCSACGEYALSFKKDTLYGGDLYEVFLTDYCPHCGAKMDGGNKNG